MLSADADGPLTKLAASSQQSIAEGGWIQQYVLGTRCTSLRHVAKHPSKSKEACNTRVVFRCCLSRHAPACVYYWLAYHRASACLAAHLRVYAGAIVCKLQRALHSTYLRKEPASIEVLCRIKASSLCMSRAYARKLARNK